MVLKLWFQTQGVYLAVKSNQVVYLTVKSNQVVYVAVKSNQVVYLTEVKSSCVPSGEVKPRCVPNGEVKPRCVPNGDSPGPGGSSWGQLLSKSCHVHKKAVRHVSIVFTSFYFPVTFVFQF